VAGLLLIGGVVAGLGVLRAAVMEPLQFLTDWAIVALAAAILVFGGAVLAMIWYRFLPRLLLDLFRSICRTTSLLVSLIGWTSTGPFSC